MKRNLGWIVSDAASAAEADAVRARALEVIEPEARVEVSRVIFNKGQLHPAHRLRRPGGDAIGLGRCGELGPKRA